LEIDATNVGVRRVIDESCHRQAKLLIATNSVDAMRNRNCSAAVASITNFSACELRHVIIKDDFSTVGSDNINKVVFECVWGKEGVVRQELVHPGHHKQ
jgi:hypothetical protein